MKMLRDIFKARDKKIILYLGALLAVGVLLMLSGRLVGGFGGSGLLDGADMAAQTDSGGNVTPPDNQNGVAFDYEQALEKRLESVFVQVEDVGRVKVMVSLTPERETVYAADSNTSETVTHETDAQGGSRETSAKTNQDKTIMLTDKTGTDRPLVLREIEPQVAGVIIIAEGGDNVFVKDALTKAACTVLGIEANKVQVLKMRGA